MIETNEHGAIRELRLARPPVNALDLALLGALRAALADVVARAIAWAGDLLTRPRASMLATRALARRPLIAAFDSVDEGILEAVTEQWFSDEAQATLRALAARLKSR